MRRWIECIHVFFTILSVYATFHLFGVLYKVSDVSESLLCHFNELLYIETSNDGLQDVLDVTHFTHFVILHNAYFPYCNLRKFTLYELQ